MNGRQGVLVALVALPCGGFGLLSAAAAFLGMVLFVPLTGVAVVSLLCGAFTWGRHPGASTAVLLLTFPVLHAGYYLLIGAPHLIADPDVLDLLATQCLYAWLALSGIYGVYRLLDTPAPAQTPAAPGQETKSTEGSDAS